MKKERYTVWLKTRTCERYRTTFSNTY